MPDKVKLFREKSLYKEWREKLGIEESINPIIYILYQEVYKSVVDFIFFKLKGRVLEVQLQDYLMKHKGLSKGQANSYISSMLYYQFLDVDKSNHYNFLQLKETVLKILGKRIPNKNIYRLKLSAMRAELTNKYIVSDKIKKSLEKEIQQSKKDEFEIYKSVREQENCNIYLRKVISLGVVNKKDIYRVIYDVIIPEVQSVEKISDILKKAIFEDKYKYEFTLHFYKEDDLKRFQRKLKDEELDLSFVKDIKLNNLGVDRYFLNLSEKQKQFIQNFEEFSIVKDITDYDKKESEKNV